MRMPKAVVVGDVKPFRFNMTMAAVSTYVRVRFSGGVTLPASANLVCGIGPYRSARCKVIVASPFEVEILAPLAPALTAGAKYEVEISSSCGSD
jgi:hypothetical protein